MKKKHIFSTFFVLILVLIAGMFYYLPYYITEPGMAKKLEPIIKVENGYKEKGDFMLTTVRMGKANIYTYLAAKMSKYDEIYSEKTILGKNVSDEEYNTIQLHMMAEAKLNAIEVAYRKAGLPVNYQYRGIYVLSVMPGMPASGNLQVGDRIYKIDGNQLESSKQFIDYVSKKQKGDAVTLTFMRDKKTKTATLKLQPFPKEPKRVGMGIELVDDKNISVNPKVTVKTGEIGGPSAGLMFTLEIYNQLTKEDYTKGWQIAGTGTIDSDGTVGPIGGIEQKIVAADKAGAEIFFAPNEKGATDSNYRAAVKTAKDIHTNMKIIPVDTFDDALNYLKKLPLHK
jgi:PDZ domain-containing protein